MLKAPQRSSAITGSACHSSSQPFVRIKLSVFLLHVSMEPSVLPLPIFLYSLAWLPADDHVLRTPTILNTCDTAPYPHLFPVLHTLVRGTARRSLRRLP